MHAMLCYGSIGSFWYILIKMHLPLNSSAAGTRSKSNFFSTKNIVKAQENVHEMIAMRPITFQASPIAASEDPLWNRPPHLNK